ncbi:hypothetical protein [Microbacterium arborescens]|uniref:hypothetical protein n=1 Tax=Microbacterium arborescens TaxID=33883 RepID=UPI00278B2456|nr:hypothetical protein [Microbacterium arborescens]MDQ1218142.1 hypothetical protein [Microbacterium arborescens]
MISATDAPTPTATIAIDPTLLALLPFIGVIVTVLVGLFGAWVQSRREHARWVREQRFEAYVRVRAIITRLEYTDADHKLADLRRGADDHDLESARQRLSEVDDYKEALLTIRADFFDATVPLTILGPASVDDATTALLDAMNRENEAEINAAKKLLVTEMRKALGVRY